MNEFWIWFWRPIAEFLGGLFLILAVCLFIGGAILFIAFIDVLKAKIKKWFDKRPK